MNEPSDPEGLARLSQGWGPFRTIVRVHDDRIEFETRGPFSHQRTSVGLESIEGTSRGRVLPARFMATWCLLSTTAFLSSRGWLAGSAESGVLAVLSLVSLGLAAALVRAGWFDVHAFLTTGGRSLAVWAEVPNREAVESFFAMAGRVRSRFLGLEPGPEGRDESRTLATGTGDGYGEDLDPTDEPGESGPEVDGPPGPRWIH